jgi:hypothetical protein
VFEDRGFAIFCCLKSHSSCYLPQVGSDTELLRQLKAFGLGEVHIQSFFGKVLQRVDSHGEWLIERRKVERDRENQS